MWNIFTFDWFSSQTSWIWLIIIIGSIAFDMITTDLVSIWFAAGGIVALVLSLFGVTLPFQILAFFVVSIALIATVGRWTRLLLKKGFTPTNVDAYIGQRVVILKQADSLVQGEGRFQGLVWTVICNPDESVEPGDVANIVEVKGNKLVVKK